MGAGDYIVISYFPFCCDHIPQTAILTNPPKESVEEIHKIVMDSSAFAEALGCLWTGDDDIISPVFVIPNAERLYLDLAEWSGGKLSKWFTLDWGVHNDTYGIVIMPRLEESIKRFKLRCLIELEEFTQQSDFVILFQPLRFGSAPLVKPNSRVAAQVPGFDKLTEQEQRLAMEFTTRNMKNMLTHRLVGGSQNRVGLIEQSDVDAEKMKILKEPFWIGPLEVIPNSEHAIKHLEDCSGKPRKNVVDLPRTF